jgi:hypothetical protein
MIDKPASGLQREIVNHAGALLSEEGWVERTHMLEPPLGGGSGEPNIQPSGEARGEAAAHLVLKSTETPRHESRP